MDIKNKLFNYGKLILEDLLSEIDREAIKNTLVLSPYAKSILKKDFQLKNIEISDSFNKSDTNFNLVISIFELSYILDFQTYFFKVSEVLENDGVLIGFFIGENSFFETRTRLWEVEEKIFGKFYNRILPMIKITDLNSLFYNSGYKNFISFKDEINLPVDNLYNNLKVISSLKPDIVKKFSDFSPKLYKTLREDPADFLDKIEILAFAASKNTKLFARKSNM
jgi:hypothetical protein